MDDTEDRFAFGKNWEEFVQTNFRKNGSISPRNAFSGPCISKTSRREHFLISVAAAAFTPLPRGRPVPRKSSVSITTPIPSIPPRRVRSMVGNPENWVVLQGSVLDENFMRGLEPADIVYSWGVLHHTGDMWGAIRNASIPLKRGGVFFIALYSYTTYMNGHLQGQPSPEQWLDIKQRYNKAGAAGKRRMEMQHMLRDAYAAPCAVIWPARSAARRKRSRRSAGLSGRMTRTAKHVLQVDVPENRHHTSIRTQPGNVLPDGRRATGWADGPWSSSRRTN